MSILSVLPQLILIIVSGGYLYKDLCFALFSQTFLFVTFNKVTIIFNPKVCTAQYYIWYFTLLPIILAHNQLFLVQAKQKTLILIFVAWFIAEIHWNYPSYLLEHQGENSFFYLWIACIIFFLTNIFLYKKLIENQILRPFVLMKDILARLQRVQQQQLDNKNSKKKTKHH